jgi:hypothetical protein
VQALLQTVFLLIGALAGTAGAAAEAALVEHLKVSRSTDDLPAMLKRRQIRALVTYSRTDFAIMPDGKAAGLQVELLTQYEKHLNKGVRREPVQYVRNILKYYIAYALVRDRLLASEAP